MIGSKLKKYRLMLDLTGATLANLSGINQPYLSKIENEKIVPPMDTFMNLVNALAKVSPITDENFNEILTEKLYQEFKTNFTFEISDLKNETVFTAPKVEGENGKLVFTVPKQVETGRSGYDVYIDVIGEHGDNWDTAYIPPVFVPESDVTKKDKIVDDYLKAFFLSNYKSEDGINPPNIMQLSNEEFKSIIIYDLEEVSQATYHWWYNHILQDFVYGDKIENDSPTYNQEKELLLSVHSLENNNGVFTPIETDNSINVSKELLDGKTVTVDLRSATDKNIRLLLDGQLLSNDELTAIKYTLNGIRYNRQNNEQNSYFGRKRQKLIDEGYFDNND